MLEGEADRIVGHHADSTPSVNMALLSGGAIHQGPTRLHLVRDALIADGTVLTARSYDRLARGGKKRMILTGQPERISEGALCSTQVTERYFGHWLKDGVAHELLAQDRELLPIVLARSPWLHEEGYRTFLGLHPRQVDYARCDRLWLLEDWEVNAHFVGRYERLRSKLRETINASEANGRVYLARGALAAGRALSNEEEVRAALERRGFTILDPTQSSAEDIARTLASARLVVSPEGSAITHAILAMPRGSGIITIVGAQHFNLAYKLICDALGIRFGLTVADAVDTDRFSQSIDRLLATIDLIERAVA